MKVQTYLCIFIIFFFACNTKTNSTKTIKKELDEEIIIKDSNLKAFEKTFKFVYSLKQNDTLPIGDVYVKWKNDSVFTDLYVIDKQDTLYSIKKNIFFNSSGFDMKASDENFNGYIFALKKNNYFILYLTNDQGIGVSDPAVIKWNYEEKIMEFQRTP